MPLLRGGWAVRCHVVGMLTTATPRHSRPFLGGHAASPMWTTANAAPAQTLLPRRALTSKFLWRCCCPAVSTNKAAITTGLQSQVGQLLPEMRRYRQQSGDLSRSSGAVVAVLTSKAAKTPGLHFQVGQLLPVYPGSSRRLRSLSWRGACRCPQWFAAWPPEEGRRCRDAAVVNMQAS